MKKPNFNAKVVDKKAILNRIVDNFGDMADMYVVVGVPKGAEERDDPEDPSMAQVAFFNEFGTDDIPERSFLRSTVDEQKRKYARLYRQLMNAVFDQKISVKKAMGILGEVASADVRRTIRKGVPPANAPATIKRKKSSKTLVDTGQLSQSITSEVRDGDPKGHEI